MRTVRHIPRISRPVRTGGVQRELGWRGNFSELVRYGARTHGALASPAADLPRDQPARNHHARAVLSRSGLFPARIAARLRGGDSTTGHEDSDRNLRRMWWHVDSVEECVRVGIRLPAAGDDRLQGDDTRSDCLARIYQG